MRGERNGLLPRQKPKAGSSPRARGTRSAFPIRPLGRRFIPACAGNALSVACLSIVLAVHPRVRGERAFVTREFPRSAGSSPRARGTLFPSPQKFQPQRFIPACAGNATSLTGAVAAGAVHPRVRGERGFVKNKEVTIHGSSPRARGTRCGRDGCRRATRFIPACAGNALKEKRPSWIVSVHPRVRGERMPLRSGKSRATGSSPRTRGTRELWHVKRRGPRFIPACAGNAHPSRPARPARSVHPRVRGERPAPAYIPLCRAGSSPRARGTPHRGDTGNAARRFIPACAGNAAIRARAGRRSPVHPRVRGERSAEAAEHVERFMKMAARDLRRRR